jgi:hypothetical protein
MARFITSIALRQANESDYEKLNHEMKKASFHMKKSNEPGNTTATRGEYNYAGSFSFKEATDAVCRAIRKTGRDYSFTINEKPVGY